MRGSSSDKSQQSSPSKGGQAALRELADRIRGGGHAYLAVDGPRGPRNHVNKGIAVLARQTGAAVINVVAIPRRRWVMNRVWDRFQVPKPFTCIDGYFGEPLFYQEGEGIESFPPTHRNAVERARSALRQPGSRRRRTGHRQANSQANGHPPPRCVTAGVRGGCQCWLAQQWVRAADCTAGGTSSGTRAT